MKIRISSDTAIDLTKELIEKYDISTIPFQVFLGDENYLDGEITADEIIEYVNQKKTLPKTGAVNEFQFEEYFSEISKGYDAVVHFSLSSDLSSTYNNAVNAAEKIGNVYVVDSKSLSTGIALLALYACELRDEGKSGKEIFDACNERVDNVQASFVLKRVDYLYKGGRCSSMAYLGANLLKIRPQIIVKDGKMISGKKFRGAFNHVVDLYCQEVLSEFSNPDLKNAFVTYTTADDETIQIAYNHLKDAGFKNIYITRAGGTITSHCGENCLGILYINDGKNK